jgi:hypothetical protein
MTYLILFIKANNRRFKPSVKGCHHEKPLGRYLEHMPPHNPTVPISSETLASFIMVPEEPSIYIAAGHPCECEYVRYGL